MLDPSCADSPVAPALADGSSMFVDLEDESSTLVDLEAVPERADEATPTADLADQPPTAPSMAPPPNGRRFPTEDAVDVFLKQFAGTAGYSLVRRRSVPKGKLGKKIIYDCQHSGQARRPSPNGNTRKTGCPFNITINCLKRTDYEYEIDSLNAPEHSHGPQINPFATPTHKIDADGRAYIKDLAFKTRQTCRAIWLSLKSQGEQYKYVRQDDVKHVLSAIRTEEYGYHTSTQHFILLMAEYSSHYVYECDEAGRLKYAYWTFLTDFDILRQHSEVMIVDNTYKVNLFNIPLFEFVTPSATGSVLHTGYALGPTEDEEFFTWAFKQDKAVRDKAGVPDPLVALTDWDDGQRNGVRNVYPDTQLQLCTWHILKNFVKAVKDLWIGSPELVAALPDPPKPIYRDCLLDLDPQSTPTRENNDMEEYTHDPRGMYTWLSDFIYASSPAEADELALRFELEWEDSQPELVKYCHKIFLHRAQISRGYTSRYRNYGHETTQLGECGHRGSKSFLCGRNNELAQMIKALHLSVTVYGEKYEAQIAKESTNLPQKYQNVDLFRHVYTKIAKKSLEIIWGEYRQALTAFTDPHGLGHSLGPCVDRLQAQKGLPCRHYIAKQCLQNTAGRGERPKIKCVRELQVKDISPQWWLRSHRWAGDPLILIRHPLAIPQKKQPQNKPHKLPENFKPSNNRRARKARARASSQAPGTQSPVDYVPRPTPRTPARSIPLSQAARRDAARIPSRWEESSAPATPATPAISTPRTPFEPYREYGPLPPSWQPPHPPPRFHGFSNTPQASALPYTVQSQYTNTPVVYGGTVNYHFHNT